MKTIEELEKVYAQACIDEVRAIAEYHEVCPLPHMAVAGTTAHVALMALSDKQKASSEAWSNLYGAYRDAAEEAK